VSQSHIEKSYVGSRRLILFDSTWEAMGHPQKSFGQLPDLARFARQMAVTARLKTLQEAGVILV